MKVLRLFSKCTCVVIPAFVLLALVAFIGTAIAEVATTSTPPKQNKQYKPDCYQMASKRELQQITGGEPRWVYLTKPPKPPYKLAFVNGFAGNAWRMQAIQAVKAWAARPENKKFVEKLSVISVGTDISAQLSAVDNFIASGYNGITMIGLNPTAFKAVIKRAVRAGVAFVPFDNVLDTAKLAQINEPQFSLGGMKAETVVALLKEKMGENLKGTILEVRGLQGNSTDRDRHLGTREVLKKYPGLKVIEVVGNWDTGTVQKVVADAFATHGHFDGIVSQHGTAGAIRAMVDAGHPIVPVAGDAENQVRIAMAKYKVPGLSAGQSPSLNAVAMQASVALLQGYTLPVLSHLPIPHVYSRDLKAGVNYFPDLPPTFNTATGFAECGLKFTPEELLAQTWENQ